MQVVLELCRPFNFIEDGDAFVNVRDFLLAKKLLRQLEKLTSSGTEFNTEAESFETYVCTNEHYYFFLL